jgi:TolB protein
MNRVSLYTFILSLSTLSIVRAEKFDLDVYAGKFDSIPIGVVDFVSTNEKVLHGPVLPWEVIAGDLDFCSKFTVVKQSTYDSAAFLAQNAGIYIDGDYTLDGTSVVLQCYLRDVLNKELIIGKKYKGDIKQLRRMAHRYSNEIVEMLFGDRGFFESRIVYVKAQKDKKSIALMDFDGYNPVVLTKNDVINLFPAFFDSADILWTSYLKGKPDIYKGSIYDGSFNSFLASKGTESSPDVSPIDGTIAYASSKKGNLDVYTCNPDASNVKQLTVHYGVDTSPSWSPNGYQIAFTSDRSGNPQIYVMDADGANQQRITFEGKYADSPAWSPKGDKIAYMAMDENGKFDLWTISPDGSNAAKITQLRGSNEYPTWSPDGVLIAFVNNTNGRGDLYVVKSDGSRLRKVTNTGDVKMPDWSSF